MAKRPTITRSGKLRVSEISLHMSVAAFLRRAWPADLVWYHPPLGEYRDQKTGAKLKRMGALAGVADLAFHLPQGRIGYIELKAADGKLTDEQADFRDSCIGSAQGYATARSVDDVERILNGWLALFGRKLLASTVQRVEAYAPQGGQG